MLKFVTVKLTEGELVVMHPSGRFVIASYQNGPALTERAVRLAAATRRGVRKCFFIGLFEVSSFLAGRLGWTMRRSGLNNSDFRNQFDFPEFETERKKKQEFS